MAEPTSRSAMAEPDLLVRTHLSRYAEPAGDPGWFGPASIAWRVHADLPSMLVGGLCALLLQTLHPLVMQGVEDHSGYRSDPFGRLQRTAEFIAGTTYGGEELASDLVRRVQRIHRVVRGDAGKAGPYRASDPDLLTYVHTTEVWSFLRAHQRYSGHLLLLGEKNRYLEEMAVVARRLGARSVPVTTEEVRGYLHGMRPQLVATPIAQSTARYLTGSPFGRARVEGVTYKMICEAAVDLLPTFARRELRLDRPAVVRLGVVRPSATVLTAMLRFFAGSSPILEAAERRMAAPSA
jgi:uncharacterized protein (DUF2236 family)